LIEYPPFAFEEDLCLISNELLSSFCRLQKAAKVIRLEGIITKKLATCTGPDPGPVVRFVKARKRIVLDYLPWVLRRARPGIRHGHVPFGGLFPSSLFRLSLYPDFPRKGSSSKISLGLYFSLFLFLCGNVNHAVLYTPRPASSLYKLFGQNSSLLQINALRFLNEISFSPFSSVGSYSSDMWELPPVTFRMQIQSNIMLYYASM